ncbi:MAG: tRNA 4-thiouridine(8) synthase ThiI, partial [Thermoplasmata archaeon]
MKAISLLSSGIDSPVAAYSLSSYVDEIIFLHADARPFTDDLELENFKLIANHLSSILPCKVSIRIVPHGKSLDMYTKGLFHPRFLCIFCKRMMVRYAEAYAKEYG